MHIALLVVKQDDSLDGVEGMLFAAAAIST
jgi:hypothetical protein